MLTIPHKEAMARLCDQLGPSGRLVGAVDTVCFEDDGRLVGDIFDGDGLIEGARASDITLRDRRVLPVGAGGAGRAIAFAVAAGLIITNRTAPRAESLAAKVAQAVPGVEVAAGVPDPHGHEVIINATSLGLHETEPLPVDPDRLTASMDIVEISAAVEVTPFRRAALDLGCRAMGGRAMVDPQIDAQHRFFGEIA